MTNQYNNQFLETYYKFMESDFLEQHYGEANDVIFSVALKVAFDSFLKFPKSVKEKTIINKMLGHGYANCVDTAVASIAAFHFVVYQFLDTKYLNISSLDTEIKNIIRSYLNPLLVPNFSAGEINVFNTIMSKLNAKKLVWKHEVIERLLHDCSYCDFDISEGQIILDDIFTLIKKKN